MTVFFCYIVRDPVVGFDHRGHVWFVLTRHVIQSTTPCCRKGKGPSTPCQGPCFVFRSTHDTKVLSHIVVLDNASSTSRAWLIRSSVVVSTIVFVVAKQILLGYSEPRYYLVGHVVKDTFVKTTIVTPIILHVAN